MSAKQRVWVLVRPLEDRDELSGACADMACFLREVSTGTSPDADEPLDAETRARSARWLAESALAAALHFESIAKSAVRMCTPNDIADRLAEFVGRSRSSISYNVAPRYTSGSPAMVPFDTALRVAEQEHAAWHSLVGGREGEARQAHAENHGRDRIVVCVRDAAKRKGFDMITGEAFAIAAGVDVCRRRAT